MDSVLVRTMFTVFWRMLDRLVEICALLDHISGQLDAIARLLRLLVEQDRVEFEADGEAWEDGEAMTA